MACGGSTARYLAGQAGILLGGDAAEDRGGGQPVPAAPGRAQRGDQIGLRAQDDAIVEDLEAVGGKRRTRRGMSTMASAVPAAGLPSVAPWLSTIW